MANRVYRVLFLCTGNSDRSIIAEALLNSDRGVSRRSAQAVIRKVKSLEFTWGIPFAGRLATLLVLGRVKGRSWNYQRFIPRVGP